MHNVWPALSVNTKMKPAYEQRTAASRVLLASTATKTNKLKLHRVKYVQWVDGRPKWDGVTVPLHPARRVVWASTTLKHHKVWKRRVMTVPKERTAPWRAKMLPLTAPIVPMASTI